MDYMYIYMYLRYVECNKVLGFVKIYKILKYVKLFKTY
jgi:hypothetical protein